MLLFLLFLTSIPHTSLYLIGNSTKRESFLHNKGSEVAVSSSASLLRFSACFASVELSSNRRFVPTSISKKNNNIVFFSCRPIVFLEERAQRKKKMNRGGQKTTLEVLELSKDRVRFIITHISYIWCNTLYHILLEEIPVIAIHTVNIETNTSISNHDFLIHRLGMIALNSRDVDTL